MKYLAVEHIRGIVQCPRTVRIFTKLAETSCLGLAAEISDLSLFEEYIIPNGHCQLGMSYHVFMAPVFFLYTNTAIVIFVVFVCGATK